MLYIASSDVDVTEAERFHHITLSDHRNVALIIYVNFFFLQFFYFILHPHSKIQINCDLLVLKLLIKILLYLSLPRRHIFYILYWVTLITSK